jgi:signal transduction histidine kinase
VLVGPSEARRTTQTTWAVGLTSRCPQVTGQLSPSASGGVRPRGCAWGGLGPGSPGKSGHSSAGAAPQAQALAARVSMLAMSAAHVTSSARPFPVDARYAPAQSRVSAWLSVGGVLVLGGLQLMPVVPALLFGHPVPPPALAVSSSSILVMLTLFAIEWLLKPRARFGVFRTLLMNLALALTLGATAGVAGGALARDWATAIHFPPPLPVPGSMLVNAAIGAFTSIFQLGFWAIAFVIPGSIEGERIQKLEVQNLRLEAAELRTQAELTRLRGQLEPHFLLNTLNMIAGLVTVDPHNARAILATLGELLADALSESRELCTVEEELSWLKRYVDILAARHGDMLQVTWHVADDVGNAVLPRLALQPLVENAVRHGALRKRGGGHVTISAARRQLDGRDCLVCSVRDDGPGMGQPRPGSIGLDNVRRRIALSFPDGQLSLERDDHGTKACVILPFSTELDSVKTLEASAWKRK